VGDSRGLWLGKYTITMRATYGDGGQQQELTASKTVWVVPWKSQGYKALIVIALLALVVAARRRFYAFWHVLKTGLPPPANP
jgi:hypothetical protein